MKFELHEIDYYLSSVLIVIHFIIARFTYFYRVKISPPAFALSFAAVSSETTLLLLLGVINKLVAFCIISILIN